MARRWTILLTIALAVLAIDQASKYWAVAALTRTFEREKAETLAQRIAAFVEPEKREKIRTRPKVVDRSHLRFRYVENPGAAWGMFGGLPEGVRVPFFVTISSLAIAFMLAFYARLPRGERLLQVALALILGGALGNFADRILRGYVIDFIDLHWRNDPRLHWPTFNVADIAISVGVAFLLSHAFFARRPAPAASASARQVQPDPATFGPGSIVPEAGEPAPGNRPTAGAGSERAAPGAFEDPLARKE